MSTGVILIKKNMLPIIPYAFAVSMQVLIVLKKFPDKIFNHYFLKEKWKTDFYHFSVESQVSFF